MPIELDQLPRGPKYSICTLVTKPGEYAEMVASFVDGGFTEPDCEFLFIDNSAGNKRDGYSGCNAFLAAARGEYVILCHQDVLLINDGKNALDAALDDLSKVDPHWAVCGNAGHTPAGDFRARISDPHGDDTNKGPFPSEVTSLDENFVVVRRSTNLGVSPHFSGFHLYASELCANARSLGLHCYVLGFHLRHKSGGKIDASFNDIKSEMIRRRVTLLRPHIIASPAVAMFFSPSRYVSTVVNWLLNSRFRPVIFAMFGGRKPKS